MKFTPDSTVDVEQYVRSDISAAVGLSLISGLVFAILFHWTFFALIVVFSYMAIGISTVYEWNKELVEAGKAPHVVFGTVRTASFVPAIVFVVALHFRGLPFALSGTLSLLLSIGYLYSLYAVGFRNIESEKVEFAEHPYTGKYYAWNQDTYIPLLEQWSKENAEDSD